MPAFFGRARGPAGKALPLLLKRWSILALVMLAVAGAGCYNNNTGETNIGGKIKFTLPAFPETGTNVAQVFTEMHYQPSFRSQEGPRLLPPADSVPITGRQIRYETLEEYQQLAMPDRVVEAYDHNEAQQLYVLNCMVCHGPTLKGEEEELASNQARILQYMTRGPFPANLTKDATQNVSDGVLFGFISGGGSQGLAARLRGRPSGSPMPEFQLMLTEEERWTLVRYLRSVARQ